ncbi:immunity 51 family protein [Bacteroides sp. ET71]|uniref:immunity 51 family protein n=1 Tax=Bacteroides sp. ET71 TaxID=2939421 RepID=UPI002011838D|nr:immunity 51 family protein [Bacteroides sp. ET71]MCL1616423.1 immunity 51 family protein [Bacteroides sp. ET71]
MDTNDFEVIIQPFFWVDHESTASVCLNVGEYKAEIFQAREDEGFEGNGYDWESLAHVFVEEQVPELSEKISFDPEGSMFCAYSKDKDALKEFILKFKDACENETLIMDLFSRAELD